MKDWLRKKFIKYVHKNLFNIINEDDILQIKEIPVIVKDRVIKRTAMYYRGKELSPDKVEQLRHSAQLFVDSDIWKLLQNEVKYIANKRIYEESGSTVDLIFGKAILRTIEAIHKKVINIARDNNPK
mgnify:CR=1 FL=1